MKMITRFSLYGFLKNFDFTEPFIILFYLSLGLSYLQIGILVAFLNICINLMEIPSGAFADLYGRKTSMLISLSSYLVSYAIFAVSYSFAPLLPALFFYAVGDAFRTGTHKAMIFDWLKSNNRLSEKTKVYGFTRSWSNYGSAISVLFAVLIVILSENYRLVFVLSLIPGVLSVINMYYYPAELNRRQQHAVSIGQIIRHTRDAVIKTVKNSQIRLLVIQNMSFDGCFAVAKNYLQPILQAQALFLTVYITLPEKQSTALVVGSVYFILHLISARSSRKSHLFAKKFTSDKKAILFLLLLGAFLTILASTGIAFKIFILSIIAYTVYFLIQNLWVPIQVAQYDDLADSSEQATILSIASQAKTIGVAILAPLTGYLADNFGIQYALLALSAILLLTGIYSLKADRSSTAI